MCSSMHIRMLSISCEILVICTLDKSAIVVCNAGFESVGIAYVVKLNRDG